MEPSQLAEARGRAYGLMAYLYSQLPDAQWLERLTAGVPDIRSCVASNDGKPGRGEKGLLRGLSLLEACRKNQEEGDIILALGVERTRLFRGIGPDYGPPPPYESVYRGEGMVMGRTSTEVVRYYRETGYELPKGWREPPDHIGGELGLMEYLSRREAEAWAGGEEQAVRTWQGRQRLFLSRHINAWVPKFCQEMRRRSRCPLFRGLAQVTSSFLSMERARFAALRP